MRGAIGLLLMTCALTACVGLPGNARSALAGADSMTLVALEPYPSDAAGERLYGYLIVGQAQVSDAAERARIADIIDGRAGRGTPAKCFNPRHAVIATRGAERIEVVICYECSQMRVYRGSDEFELVTTDDDGSVLDERFEAHGLHVAE